MKRVILRAWTWLMVVMLVLTLSISTSWAKRTRHKVRRGETFALIAEQYGVSVKKLKRWNKKVDPRRLRVGQRVTVYPSSKRKSVKYHRVRRGDSFGKIAKKYGVSVKSIRRWNPGIKPTRLRRGQKVRILTRYRSRSKSTTTRSKKSSATSKKTKKELMPDRPKKIEAEVVPTTIATTPTEPTLEPERGETKAGEKKVEVVEHVVQEGETLGSIAIKYVVDIDDVMAWNDVKTLAVEPGKKLIVKSEKKVHRPKKALPVVHRVRRGDSFGKIAKKYGVSVKSIRRWNRSVNPRRLQIGQRIRMYIPGRDGHSISYGSPNRGRLYNGVALETTSALQVRSVAHSYGIQRVVNLLKAAAADVKARWPDAPRLVVGDLSYRRGGRIKRHKSHQSGRDADISYYFRSSVQTPDFYKMDYETFDAAKNWHILSLLMASGEVEYVFVNYPLQKILYEYARSIGYTAQELEPLIQYPRSRHKGVGIIRHARGHDDHWHIRFKCPPEGKHCR